MKIEEYVPFSALTTFAVGGFVRYVLTLESADECAAAVAFAASHNHPLIPVGGGSNILGVDGVLDAVCVRVGMHALTMHGDELIVDAGADWDAAVSDAVQNGLWGIENLSAIPGTMGGAVVQNIGAYGAVLSDTLLRVVAYDTESDTVRTFSCEECAFGYRTSIFKTERDRYIVLSATLTLSREVAPNCTYKDLALRFEAQTPTLSDIRTAVCEIRATKFPSLKEHGTAGSFFLNPVVSHERAQELQTQFPGMPVFVLPEGGVKIPLGWFFEHVLKLRGYRVQNVEAWRAQALVLATHSGATADEVKKFAQEIIFRVRSELGIDIEPEVRML
jgi:UDP-N-acetylmuramate dehydrogenase